MAINYFQYGIIIPLLIMFIACQENENKAHLFPQPIADTSWMSLTLREKIGQMVCMGYNKNQMLELGDGSLDTFFKKYPVGAFFIANWEMNGRNTDSLSEQYKRIVTELSKTSKYPLLFSEDFESGLGSVMPNYTPLVSEMGLGATNSEQYAEWYGEIIASELRSIGINWILNPVADLNLNPCNYLTNVRSLGDDANRSVKMLPKQVLSMKAHGLAATAKHFPGDGTDYINQHFNTSQMKLSYNEWMQQHGKVFKTLIDSGLMVIMAGHISFPAYQKEKLNGEYLPVTLSKELMTNLLKGTFGFKGVIVSDALNMAGIAGYYENELETEVECFKAGADILLWPSITFIDTIEARVLRHEIPIERLNDAVNRIWNLKKQLGLFDASHSLIEPISAERLQQNRQRAQEIAQKSITLLSNKNGILPLDTLNSKNILLCVISEGDQTATFSILKNELCSNGFHVKVCNNLSYFNVGGNLDQLIKTYDKFIFAFYSNPGNPWGSLDLRGDQALTMWTANKLPFDKVISIGFGDPYKNLIYMPRTWCRINCYSVDQLSQKALVDGLTGVYKFTGISPVNYPE